MLFKNIPTTECADLPSIIKMEMHGQRSHLDMKEFSSERAGKDRDSGE